jgi:HEAT repeat protein
MKPTTAPHWRLRFHLGLALLVGMVLSAAAALNERSPVPAGARVALTFTNGTNFTLGEVIELTFTLSNAGPEPFAYTTGGDYRGTGFPTRYKFTVTDATGDPLTPETWMDMGGLSGPRTLKPGEQHDQSLRLQNYVLVDRPGAFTVRVTHDFGWQATPDMPLPVAAAKIMIALPTPSQAEQRVNAAASGQDALRDHELGSYWHKTNFRYLSHPVFLPALEKQAAAGNVRALEGVQRMPTTNATLALARLLANDDTNVVHAAALFLARRKPPRMVNGHPRLPFGSFGATETGITNFWRSEVAEPLRLAAGKLLRSTNTSHVRTGAFVIEAIGTAEDGALVLDALTPVLSHWRLREKPEENILNTPGAGDALIAALAGLRERGWRAPRNGGVNTILARFLELGDPRVPRRDGWEQTLEAFFTQNPPMLREAAVRALPKPPTGKWEKLLMDALNDRDRGVMRAACTAAGESSNFVFTTALANIVRTERHEWVVREASGALARIGAHWAATDAWIERLADEKMFQESLRFLAEKMEHPKSFGSGSRNAVTREGRIALRERWQHFFSDEKRRAIVQSGRPVPVTEAEARDLLGGAISLWLEGGERWPAETQ